jgi:tetratricopeptide (TPR) repeat protein
MSIHKIVAAAGLSAFCLLAGPTGPMTRAFAVDTVTTKDAPDLSGPRARIAAKDWAGARVQLTKMIDAGVQHADVYNLMGYVSRQLGDFSTSLTYYGKALDFDPDHRAAREYLGELFLQTGQRAKAEEQLKQLDRLCPGGCEEREDLAKAIAAKT